MKMAKRVASLAMVLILAMSLVACGEKGIVGTWEITEEGMTVGYTFEKDGSCKTNLLGMEIPGTYETKGDKITITMTVFGSSDSTEYTYKVDGDKLTLTSADEDGQVTSVTLNRK